MTNFPTLNELAPDFQLNNQTGDSVSRQDFVGKWLILYFYPKDNTPGCTTEAQDFTALKDQFTALGAIVVGVSPDSEKSHGRFIEKKELALQLLSDPEHQMAETYGVWQLKKMMGKEYMGVVRSTFLLNPEGILVHVWPKVKVKGHAAAVLEKLKSCQAD